jgi:hypothetical protein
MKNIHLLSTEKPSRLVIDTIENKLYLQPILHEKTVNVLTQNIYITSNEEIKEGCYVISTYDKWKGNGVLKPQIGKILEIHEDYYLIDSFNGDNDNKWDKGHSLKIILTTDSDLIKDGVQAIDNDFLEWFVKNSSCEYVEVEKICNNCGEKDCIHAICHSQIAKFKGDTYKIIIPQEDPKQEILEEHNISVKEALLLMRKAPITFVPNKKMYSEEEFLEFSEWVSHNDWVYLPSKGYWVNEEQEELEQKLSSKEILNLWFEQLNK